MRHIIDLQIKPDKTYRISWNDDYTKLYLSIYSIILAIDNPQIMHSAVQKKGFVRTIVINKRREASQGFLSRLQNGLYRFEIYDNEMGEGAPLEVQKQCFGGPKELRVYTKGVADGFVEWKVACDCFISRELFWISLIEVEDSDKGGCFFFPQMEKGQLGFETSCLLRREAFEKFRLYLDKKISDYVNVREC